MTTPIRGHVEPPGGPVTRPALASTSLPHPCDRLKVIACATVIEELARLMPPETPRQVIDLGLHRRPADLAVALQAAIDGSDDVEAILLGYGLCSGAVVGLRATRCRLVIPRVDDCIAILLGSRDAYRTQARREPGTYYLTKGWIEAGGSPFDEADRLAARYGAQTAERIVRRMLAGYTRLAFIGTGPADVERSLEQARGWAARFGLRFEVLAGSPSLVETLLFGPWDEGCVVVEQGDVVRLEAFLGDPRPLDLTGSAR